MHPRLNFWQFNKERNQRKKRTTKYWIVSISAMLIVFVLIKDGPIDRFLLKEAVPLEKIEKNSNNNEQIYDVKDSINSEKQGLFEMGQVEVEESHNPLINNEVLNTEEHESAIIPLKSNQTDDVKIKSSLIVSKDQDDNEPNEVESIIHNVMLEDGSAVKLEEGASSEKLIEQEKNEYNRRSLKFETQWLPVQSSILAVTEGSKFRSLNSFGAGVEIPLTSKEGIQLLISPNYQVNRYQFQYEYSWVGYNHAPGSVVSYRESNAGYQPILSDTINGVFTRRVRSNGQVSEAYLPIEAQWIFYNSGPIKIEVNAFTGVRIRTRASGIWSDENGIQPVNLLLGNQGRISPYFGVGAEVMVNTKYLELFVRGQSLYLNTGSVFESRNRHQIVTGLRVLI